MEIKIHAIEDLNVITASLISHIQSGYRVILLSGDLGSGKTTLTQHLCIALGVTEPVTSPTFSLINEYPSQHDGLIYHMDLYRLENPEQLVQIGLEEYLDSGHLCLIEWPEVASACWTMKHIRVKIEAESDNIRKFIITTHDAVDA